MHRRGLTFSSSYPPSFTLSLPPSSSFFLCFPSLLPPLFPFSFHSSLPPSSSLSLPHTLGSTLMIFRSLLFLKSKPVALSAITWRGQRSEVKSYKKSEDKLWRVEEKGGRGERRRRRGREEEEEREEKVEREGRGRQERGERKNKREDRKRKTRSHSGTYICVILKPICTGVGLGSGTETSTSCAQS